MVYRSEEISDFRSHSPLSHESEGQVEMEIPSETSVFLPEDNSSNDSSGSGGDLNVTQVDRRGSSVSRNLGILVISDGLPPPVESEVISKDGSNISINAEICKGKGYLDDEEAQKKLDLFESLRGKGGGGDDEESEMGKSRGGCCRNYAGIFLTLASGLVFTIGGVIVKYLKEYHPFTLAIFRFQGILIPGLCMVLYAYYVRKVPVFEPVWPVTQKRKGKRVLGLIFRCVFGTTALLFHFYALQRLDVADALVIGSCQPVFVTFAAHFLLGEACGVFPVFTALLTIVGVGVISRPPILTGQEAFDRDTLIGAGFSMSSVLTATMVFIIIRYLKDVHVSLITFVLGCWGTLQSVICSVIIGEFRLPDTLEHWILAVTLAVITLLGQVTMTLALQCEQAGSVAVVRTCDCLFAFLLQFLLLNTVPDLFSLTGASIIIFSIILTTFRKWIASLPKTHSFRKRFWFVMV